MARVLIIDDEGVIREVIRVFLEWEGHEVIEAPDGEAGLRLQREHQADLIITDLMMPNVNGFEVIRQLRRDYSNIGIIVVSASDGLGLLRARQLGADRTLDKPFTRKKLMKAVEDLLCKN